MATIGAAYGPEVPDPPTPVAELLAECRAALGDQAVVTDPDVLAAHTTDWTGRWRGHAPAVLRPVSTAQVATVVQLARTHHVALVPQGGNTGLVGGATPLQGEVVVDLRGLDDLGRVDLAAGQVTAGAGVTLEALEEHAAASGLSFPVDLAARATATVGGMVATNAGGVHVVRHGTMRAQVLGVEAVLGTGEVVAANLDGLVKDNTGYDLPGLLCGSEGTLGIVTAARLRLVPRPAARLVALVGLGSVDEAVESLPAFRRCPSLQAIELVLDSGLRLVARHLRAAPPIDPLPPCALLVELAGDGELLDELGSAFDAFGHPVLGSAIGVTDADRARLWRWREGQPEVAAALGVVHKADVSVPSSGMGAFVVQVGEVVGRVAPGAPVLVYGHLGDGNLHVNIVVSPDEEAVGAAAIDAVLDLTLHLGGSVSAEHGIGVAKRAWLERQRGPQAVAAMRAIKAALDPDGICNPGALLPPI
jgi:FAD/FMN-containing dehydrogenase